MALLVQHFSYMVSIQYNTIQYNTIQYALFKVKKNQTIITQTLVSF